MVELTVKEFAAREGVTESTVRGWLSKGWVQSSPSGGVIPPPLNIITADRHGYSWSWFSGVYFLRCGEFVKIGYAHDVRVRMEAIRTHNPYKVEPIGFIECKSLEEAKRIEREHHERFAHLRSTGEWFRTEPDLVDHVQSLSGRWPSPKGVV